MVTRRRERAGGEKMGSETRIRIVREGSRGEKPTRQRWIRMKKEKGAVGGGKMDAGEGKPRQRGWESRDSCTMSRVTSCRLPRVFSFPSLVARSFSLSLLSPFVHRATSLPTCPHSRPAYSSSHELVLFPLSSERYPPTRLERGAKYIVDTRQQRLRSRDSLHRRRRRRALMLSCMICLTLPRGTSLACRPPRRRRTLFSYG